MSGITTEPDMTVRVADTSADRDKMVAFLKRHASSGLVWLAVLWATVPLARATGGRDPLALTWAALPAVAAFAGVRPWRILRPSLLVIAGAVAVAPLVVCAVTPPGWFGATAAASYGVTALLFVTVAAHVRGNPKRAAAIAALVVLGGGAQFFTALVPWWGGRDPSLPMLGTFYWHNQFGAFLLAPALLGLALAVANKAPYRFVGWVVTPFAVAGIVYSSSRGSQLALIAGWTLSAALLLAARGPFGRRLLRLLAMSALCAGVTFALTGPPLFPSRTAPWASTQARAATGATLDANSSYRVTMWHDSIIVFEHNVPVGAGFGELANQAMKLKLTSRPPSPLSHNGYLQPLVAGGLLLGVPFLAACAAILVGLLRRAWFLLRGREKDPVLAGAVAAALALMAHSFIDFDWSYPALFTLAGLVAGIAWVGPGPGGEGYAAPLRRSSRAASVAAAAVLAAAVAIGAAAAHHGQLRISAPVGGPSQPHG